MLNDTTTLNLIRDFLQSPKSSDTTPYDVLAVVTLLAYKAVDHDVRLSHGTLANILCCDPRTVYRCQEKLSKLGWINLSPSGKFNANGFSVSVDSLPIREPAKLQVSAEAKEISLRYKQALQKIGRKRFPKGWLEKQWYSAQRILAEFPEKDAACGAISFAMSDSRFAKQSRKSLYGIVGLQRRWKAIKAAYETSSTVTPQGNVATASVQQG